MVCLSQRDSTVYLIFRYRFPNLVQSHLFGPPVYQIFGQFPHPHYLDPPFIRNQRVYTKIDQGTSLDRHTQAGKECIQHKLMTRDHYQESCVCDQSRHLVLSIFGLQKGPSRALQGRYICHLFRRDIGFIIAGNRIRYTHGTGNFLIFLLGKRENMK